MKKIYLTTVSLLAISCASYPKYESKQAEIHCVECPSEKCICIQGETGEWYISPEVGE